MIRYWTTLGLVAVVIATTVPVPSASAEPTSKAYVNNIRAGRKAMDKGKTDAALRAFEKALSVEDTNEVRLLLAKNLLTADRADDAVAQLTAIADRVEGEDARAFDALLQEAGPKASPLSLAVDAGGVEADVLVDGKKVGTTASAVRIQPGRHTVAVSKPGYSSAEQRVLALPGKLASVSLPITALMGTLRLQSDTDGVMAKVAGQSYELIAGQAVEVQVATGEQTVEYTLPSGDVVSRSYTVAPNATVEASYLAFGSLVVAGIDRPVKLTVGDTTFDYAPGAAPRQVIGGEQSLLIAGQGLNPVRGTIVIAPGKTTTVTVNMANAPDYTVERALGWTALGLGLALVVTTVVIEETVDFDDGQNHDAVIWSLAGAGTALTITGGVVLREVFAAEQNPTVNDVSYDVKVGVAPYQDGAALSLGFTY